MKNINITVEVEGKVIEAETIFTSPSEFRIKLKNSEFSASMATPHIPYFALSHHRFFESNGEITEYGLERAKEMVKYLYITSQVYEVCKEEIHSKIPELKKYYDVITLKIGRRTLEFQATKRDFKKDFKNNVINEKYYRELLHCLEYEKFLNWQFGQDIQSKFVKNFLMEFPAVQKAVEEHGGSILCSLQCQIYKLLR